MTKKKLAELGVWGVKRDRVLNRIKKILSLYDPSGRRYKLGICGYSQVTDNHEVFIFSPMVDGVIGSVKFNADRQEIICMPTDMEPIKCH